MKAPVLNSNNKVLKQLSALSIKEGTALAQKLFPLIGKGSARKVFKINDGFVLKIAFNKKGIAQNLIESKPELQTEVTNNVLFGDPRGKWIVNRLAKPIDESIFQQKTGLDFEAYSNALLYKFNQESNDWPKPKNYDVISKNKFFKNIVELVALSDLMVGDLIRIENYVLVNGKVKLSDFGLTHDVYNEFYE